MDGFLVTNPVVLGLERVTTKGTYKDTMLVIFVFLDSVGSTMSGMLIYVWWLTICVVVLGTTRRFLA